MKLPLLFLSIFSFAIFAQENTVKLNADQFIGVDNLENVYFIKANVLHKKFKEKTVTYTNLHLGTIDLVDITNPLKIVIFYKIFNSVIVLDDELNELSDRIDFNTILQKNINYVGTTSNSNLWLFSKDDNNLIVFDYSTKKTVFTKQLDNDFVFSSAFSNYHHIWLISDTMILQYNVYGSFITQYNIKNIEKAIVYKNGIIYKTNNNLYYLINDNKPELITMSKDLIIKDFYINNDLIYFFDGNIIYTQEFIKK